ncbi:hypothetical protein AAGW05_12525 [Arthrobacter sp. LAPM80]|uniref:hypothetical protein n=1 Tax=Arthrobacter sp. LAPM80 TaxID=3141788 RepID=UPI00398B30E1
MNGTRRGLNRTLLGLMGLVLIGAGAMAILAGTSSRFAQGWTSAGTSMWARVQENLAAARIPGTSSSWWSVGILAFLIVSAVLLVWWMASQGTGRSNQLARQDSETGNTTVDTAVASQAVKAALQGNNQILATSVQSWKTRGYTDGAGLKISVQARKGASPTEVGAAVGQVVDDLDELLGRQLPVLVRIKAGTRTKFARTERVA